jgi:CRISPR type III-A-associated protein Csm2
MIFTTGGYNRQNQRQWTGDQQRGLDDLFKTWGGYLKGGYFDGSGNLRIELVSRNPMEEVAKEMAKARPALKTHQLRRYFGHCRSVESRLLATPEPRDWAEHAPDVKKLDIAAADGAGKSEPKIPRLFGEFIRRNTETVKNEKDFLKGFLPHFEALVAFGAGHFGER